MQDSGVYCLLLRLSRGLEVRIAHRRRRLETGYYLYVGSALRGLEARIRRHRSRRKRRHWHIDALTEVAHLHRVFLYPTRSRTLECRLSRLLAVGTVGTRVPGFGASDCRCPSHLYYFEDKPDFNPFALHRPPDLNRLVRILSRTYPVPPQTGPEDPFRTLVTCVISLRTKDEVTDRAARRLFRSRTTPAEIAAFPASEISRRIYPAGFYREKGRTIRRIAEILVRDHRGRVPGRMEDLLALPGVGRKTANLVLGRAFGTPSICVDTHVHRISNRLGIVATDTPEETELALRRRLAEKHWIAINRLLVGHGQHTCHPTSPRCSQCPIAEECLRDGVRRSR